MTKTFADKINDWKTAIEAKIGSMIEEHANDSTAHSNLFSDKSKVTFTRALNNGTRIGTLTIDGTSTDIFCETDTNTTYNTATASANGLMSKEDKVKLNNIDLNKIQDRATYVSIDDDLNLYIGYDPITDILLTSDKSVIQSGQTATLTSTAKNGNALLEGVPISFYAGNDYLGSAVTNSNGIGTFSYIGAGAGSKQITAKCGSDQSEPYPLWDTLFYDIGIDDSKASSYSTTSTDTEISYSSDGTKMERTSSSSSSYNSVKINNSLSWRDTNTDYCIELDISYGRPSDSNGGEYVSFGGQTISMWDLFHANSGSGHIMLKTNGNTLEPYVDGTHISTADKTMSATDGFKFQCYQKCWITFKNLKIYTI